MNVSKIKASVRWKLDFCHSLNGLRDGSDTFHSLDCGHGRPFLVQLNAHRVFHNDILAAGSV